MGNTSSSINYSLLNQSINRYVPIPLLLFGGIGNLLNLLIFTRRIFRNNVCVTYFLASTIFDSFVIVFSLLPRLLYGYAIDPTQYSSILCKLRFFVTYLSGYTAAWFISLAYVERYLSSSRNVHRRHLITMKRAYFSMFIVFIMGFVIFGEHFYCIDINQDLLGAPQSCYQLKQNIRCQIVDSLMQFIFEILTPTLMMIIAAVNHQSPSIRVNRRAQKLNTQLITMLLVQVVIFAISTFPISIYKLYSVATIYQTKSILRKSIESTIFNVSVLTLFVNNVITFYIYT